MKPKVYVETSFLSYLAAKPSLETITAGRQKSSWEWWEKERRRYDLAVSSVVVDEIIRGDPKLAQLRERFLSEVSIFAVNERMLDLARLLIVPGAIPERASDDAIHIAAAAVEECEFLLTWNFKHIANVHIRRKVERILLNHGYSKTNICTPEEFF